MALDNRYFSFCKTLGLMKEKFTRQRALDAIKNAVKNDKAADPAFVAEVEKLTLNSREVYIRVCVLYHYQMNVKYVAGGAMKSTVINDFGHSGVPDSLKLTKFGEGEYTTLQNASQVPFPVYNDENLFTLESMKSALAKVIEERLPNATDYQTNGWDVSAYFVPTLIVDMHWNGKRYPMYYNLQNGCYHWDYPDNPALLKKGATAKTLSTLATVGSYVLSVLSALTAISAGLGAAIPGVIAFIITHILAKKNKHSKNYYQKYFLNNPEKGLLAPIKFIIPMLIVAIIAFVLF